MKETGKGDIKNSPADERKQTNGQTYDVTSFSTADNMKMIIFLLKWEDKVNGVYDLLFDGTVYSLQNANATSDKTNVFITGSFETIATELGDRTGVLV